MRVLHVAPSFARRDGGPSELLRGLLPALRAKGVDVTLATTDKGVTTADHDLLETVDSVVVRSYPPRRFTFAPGIARALLRALPSVDVVHVHGVNTFPSTVAMLLARLRGVPYVLEPHGAFDHVSMSRRSWLKKAYNSTIDAFGLRGISRVIVSSAPEREHARAAMTTEAIVMPLGVPEDLFNVERETSDEVPSRILFLGRIASVKRLDLVLHALAKEALADLPWQLTVAGPQVADLPYDPEELAQRLGISDRVTWLGQVDGASRRMLLAKCDLFIAPSESESFGMAVAEAMAAGCAVVASRQTGIVGDAARTGAAIAVDIDVDEISAAIGRLLTDAGEREQLGRQARAYAIERFRWSAAADAALTAYRGAIRERQDVGRRVSLTQPYVAAYRVPLFDALRSELAEREIELEIYADAPRGEQAARGDRTMITGQHPLPTRSIRIGRRTIELRSLPRRAATSDLVVTELAVGNVLAWRRLLLRRPTVLWGHGAAYVTAPSRLGTRLKTLMVRLARHTMTYTEGGRTDLIVHGAPADRITAIGNSTDTETLREAIVEFRRQSTHDSGPRALFVGGLDSSKRIDFLLEAARHAVEADPKFTLTVVGRGPLEGTVRAQCADAGGIQLVPEARGRALAELAASTDMIWMPGRVGLVAVDAIALGLPIHTVAHATHAPEIELLRDDEVEFLPDDPQLFAHESLRRAGQLPLREDYPTVERVARRMADTLADAIHQARTRNGANS